MIQILQLVSFAYRLYNCIDKLRKSKQEGEHNGIYN